MFDIIRSLKESDRNNDFVAIGNLIEGANSYHAGFVIKYEGKLLEFHYTGREIELKQLENDYFHKITDTILADEVPAFIAQCKNILKKANPIYGFYYSGESYDYLGNHVDDKGIGERMTCVGFCLNVLKGFLEEDYLVYSDWTSESNECQVYIERYCRDNEILADRIVESQRRITPRECLTSCFFTKLPITKTDIDQKRVLIDEYFNKISTN